MALTVEDGTIVAGAESYISVSDANTYHTNRGNSSWTGADSVKEAALRKATDFMLQLYRAKWKGVRMSATQALDWPRGYVYLEPVITGANTEFPNLVADDIVPNEVKNACAELALRSLSDTLYADQGQVVLSESVGPLSVTYDKNSPQRTRYVAVDSMLRPYFKGNDNQMELIRT